MIPSGPRTKQGEERMDKGGSVFVAKGQGRKLSVNVRLWRHNIVEAGEGCGEGYVELGLLGSRAMSAFGPRPRHGPLDQRPDNVQQP
jgi:hypothetical protein